MTRPDLGSPTILRLKRSESRRMSRRSPAGQRRTVIPTPIDFKATAGMPSQTFHYVYILINEDPSPQRYIGVTQDLKARLEKHNSGSVAHTKKFRPWKIQTAIAFDSKEKAVAFEKYLKSGSGREFARRHF